MNAVSLYLSTCRYVMQAKTESPSSWSELYKYLPYLRQALACCVCTKILQIPVGPIDSICQHHICDTCRGGKMRLRPSCSWCKDHVLFVENTQLRIIVQCYKQLCKFLSSLDLASNLADLENGDKNSLLKIITEGSEITDTYSYNANPLSMSALSAIPLRTDHSEKEGVESVIMPLSTVSSLTPILRGRSRRSRKRIFNNSSVLTGPVTPKLVKKCDQLTQTDNVQFSEHDYYHDELDDTNIDELRLKAAHLRSRDDTGENAPQRSKAKAPHLGEHDYMKGPLCYSSVMPNGDEPKLTIRRRPTIQLQISKKKAKVDKHYSHITTPLSAMNIPRQRKHKSKDGKKKGCRCGMATPTPGKLTCCGQRCPCYTAWKPCIDCICRGCHNPRKEPPPMLSGDTVAEEVEISVV